ncbi:MAG TPA: isocitrate lyase/phosphoenolpyruvate mutase family protein [bacterium]|nr:isocitrate lyase/phosphoenolpyruvate mutase family protein [bacterium]
MSGFSESRQALRALLAGQRCVMPASVFDATSARIAEALGFESVMLAGSVASLAVLGAPDLIVLTLSELAEQVHRICRATQLPLLVDADHGYGNALNVMRTVQELEDAGVSALSIEDTVLPRTYGEAAPSLTSIEEGVGKMRAALAARRDRALIIAGRTSALAITSTDDAVARAKAYEAAGVDAMFLVGARSRTQLEAVASAIRIPLIVGGAAGELADTNYLAAQRVRVRIPPHQPFMAAVQAVHATLSAMRQGVPPVPESLASPELMKRVTCDGDYGRWTRDFLGGSS